LDLGSLGNSKRNAKWAPIQTPVKAKTRTADGHMRHGWNAFDKETSDSGGIRDIW